MAPNSRKLHSIPMKWSIRALTGIQQRKTCQFGTLSKLICDATWLRYYVFYSATVPFLSTIHLLLDLSLYFTTRLRPLYALIGAIIFLCGWSGQVGVWSSCELPSGSENSGQECYQFYLEMDGNWGWKGIPLSLANTKAAFGYLCILL